MLISIPPKHETAQVGGITNGKCATHLARVYVRSVYVTSSVRILDERVFCLGRGAGEAVIRACI